MDTTQPHREVWLELLSLESLNLIRTKQYRMSLVMPKKLCHCRTQDVQFTEQCQIRLSISTPETARSLDKQTPATSTPAQQQQQHQQHFALQSSTHRTLQKVVHRERTNFNFFPAQICNTSSKQRGYQRQNSKIRSLTCIYSTAKFLFRKKKYIEFPQPPKQLPGLPPQTFKNFQTRAQL